MSDKPKQTPEGWLAFLTDDAAKVDYMKAHVAAQAATEGTRIVQQEQTRRHDISEGSNVVRGLLIVAVAAVLGGATCAWETVQSARVDAEHPRHVARDAGSL